MPLQKQTVAFPLTKGLDRSKTASTLDPDQLADGVNTEILKSGEITKRAGFQSQVTLPARTPLAMVPMNNTAGVLYDGQLASTGYIDASGNRQLQDISNIAMTKPIVGKLSVKLQDILSNNKNSVYTGSSFYDYKVVNQDIYTDPTTGIINVVVLATDLTSLFTNANIWVYRYIRFDRDLNIIPFAASPYAEWSFTSLPNTKFSNFGVRCIKDKVLYCLFSTAGNEIRMVSFDANGVASNTAIQTGVNDIWGPFNSENFYAPFDACEGEANEFLLIYGTGGNNLVLSRRSYSTGASLASVNIAGADVIYSTVFTRYQATAGKDVFVAVSRIQNGSNNKLSVFRYNSALTLQTTSNYADLDANIRYLAISGVATSSPSLEAIAVEQHDNVGDVSTLFMRTNGTSLSFYGLRQNEARIASRSHQIESGQNPVIILWHKSNDTLSLQNCYALYQYALPSATISTAGFCATFGYGYANDLYLPTTYTSIYNVASNRALVPLQFRTEADIADASLRLASVSSDATYIASPPLKLAGQTYLAHGSIYQFSGAGLRETSFFLYPDPPISVTDAGTGTVTPTGTRLYCLVYEYIDEAGNLIESAASESFSFNVATTSRNWSIGHALPGFCSYPKVNLVLYRTVVNGTIFYKSASVTYDLTNPPTTAISLVDKTSDSDLVKNKLLYTTGGVVENTPPPNTYWLSVAKRRLWTYEYGSTDTVWFSKEIREGFFPSFSDLLKLTLDRNYGEIMGIGSIDDNVIILKRQGIYVTGGDGPTETLIGQFNVPVSLAQGIGCINSRSIVETPQGIFFQSQEGIYIVDKGLSVSFVGQPLYKSEGTILAGLYDANLNRVLLLSTTDIWSYYLTTNTWHRWPVSNPVDLQIIDGQIYLLTTTRLLRQVSGIWQDNAVNYEQRITLGQMQLSGIQGYQRVYRILVGGRQSDSASGNITVNTYFDYNTTATDTFTIAQSATLSNGITRLEVRPSVQKCETMQLSLSHTANNSGMTIDRLSAEVGAIGGIGRRAPTVRAT